MKDDESVKIAIPIDRRNEMREKGRTNGIGKNGDPMFTLTTPGGGVGIPVVFTDEESNVYDSHPQDSRIKECIGVSPTLNSKMGTGGNNVPLVREEKESNYVVRRITPKEAERLQGFPDGYTDIPWPKSKDGHAPDSHRYKALGNSMAVPVMRWIGERIMEALDNPITEDTSEPIAWQPELF